MVLLTCLLQVLHLVVNHSFQYLMDLCPVAFNGTPIDEMATLTTCEVAAAAQELVSVVWEQKVRYGLWAFADHHRKHATLEECRLQLQSAPSTAAPCCKAARLLAVLVHTDRDGDEKQRRALDVGQDWLYSSL